MDRPKTAEEARRAMRLNMVLSDRGLDLLQAYVELSVEEAIAALLERLKEEGRLS